jgi:hypothetical protein
LAATRLSSRRASLALLQATEKELEKIVKAAARERRPLRGREKLGVRVGRVLGRFKMGKHIRLEITDTSFGFERDPERIEDEARLDGTYVVRTTVPEEERPAELRLWMGTE